MRNRSLLLLCFGELVSTAGSALTTLAASILIYRLTGSALRVSLVLIATVPPSIVVGLFAGVWVDRFDRKKILLASDLIRAVLSFLIPTLAASNQLWLYAIVLLSGTVGQFFNPAHESILPEIAGEKDLAAANSLMAISGFASTAIGFALCGWMTSRFPLQWAFYLDAFTFLFSFVCIWIIHVPQLRATDRMNIQAVFQNLQAGVRTIQGNPVLRSLIGITLPAFLAFGLWNSLLLPFTLHLLRASSFDYGIQEGFTSLSFIAGSLAVRKLGGRIKEGPWIVAGSFMFIVAGILWGIAYLLYHQPAGLIPLSYGIISLGSIIHFRLTGQYQFFRSSRLVLFYCITLLVRRIWLIAC